MPTKRAWAAGTAGLVAVAVLAVAVWRLASDGGEVAVPAVAVGAVTSGAPARTAPAPTVPLEVLLLPDGDVEAIPGSVRIGLAQVSVDDASAAALGAEGAAEAAGATRYQALATVTRWVPAAAQRLADGRVRVGPLRLPAADRYLLQARGDDGLRFYSADFDAGTVPATLAPMVGAGLRIQGVSGNAGVLLRRVEGSDPSPPWQRLQAWSAPELLEAFDETPLAVADGQVLAPFAPGPVDIVLEVDGIEAERRSLTLPAGRVTGLRFDAMNQAVAAAVSIELELEFVRRGSATPIQGLRVQWLGGREPQDRITDASGRVRFTGVDRQRAQPFNLIASTPAGGLPEWPELRPLRIAEEALAGTGAHGERVRHRVELAPLQWLIARLPPQLHQRRPDRNSPYPIHVLQRQHGGGWTDTSADHFIPTPDGLAVSIAEPGTYRLASALSPWQVLESSPAVFGEQERQSVDVAGIRGADVTMSVRRDGRTLAGAPVQVVGPLGGLPPARLTADAGGRVRLPSTTVPWVEVEVPGSDQIRVLLDGPRALADFGTGRSQ